MGFPAAQQRVKLFERRRQACYKYRMNKSVWDDDAASSVPSRGDEGLEAFVGQIRAAVERAAAGVDAAQVLEELLAKLPPHLRAAIIKRFRQEMERLNAELAEHERNERTRAGGKGRFTLSDAARLMTAGTLEKIRAMLSRRPDLQRTLNQVGADMLRHGVAADPRPVNSLDDVVVPTFVSVDQTRGRTGRGS